MARSEKEIAALILGNKDLQIIAMQARIEQLEEELAKLKVEKKD